MKKIIYAFLCSTLMATSAWAGLLETKMNLQYQQYPEALRGFKDLVEKGSPVGSYYLGYMYLNGLGVQKSPLTAYKYFLDANEKSYLPAAAELGHLLLVGGNGIPVDPNRAVFLLKKAALAGSASAAYDLGVVYMSGLGTGVNAIPVNYNYAFGYFLIAALKGDKKAQQQLCKMYLVGRGIPQDYAKAMMWLTRSANQGYIKAQLELASLLESDPRLQNVANAYAWYSVLAAYNSDSVGANAAAKRDEIGQTLSVNVLAQQQEAVRQWKPTTPEGSVPEEERNTTDIPKIPGFNDPNTLQQILSNDGVLPLESTKYGVTQEMIDLAEDTQNLTQLELAIEKSMKRGNVRAGAYYGDLLQKRFANDEEAFKWYKKSAEAGDSYAQYQLAKFYCEGRSVKPDAAECYAWLLSVEGAQNPVLNTLVQQALIQVRSNATPEELERGMAKVKNHDVEPTKEEKKPSALGFL